MFIAKIAAAVLAAVVWLPALAEDFHITLPGHDGLVLNLPSGWHAQVARPQAELPPTITLEGANPASFQVLITPLWPANGTGPATTNELRQLVQGAANQAQPQAVERALTLRDFAGAGKRGYYFSATDRHPEPGGYKYLTQGAVGFDELRITFTVLVNGEPAAVTGRALELLRGMRRSEAKNAM